jgi:hypothetical protein
VHLTYAGKGRFVSRDAVERRVVIEASGKDSRGTGTAAATVTAVLSPDGEGTRVHVVTDLRITGAAAQFGRGMIDDVAGRLVGQFAYCLAKILAADIPPASPAAATTVNGAAVVPEVKPIDLLAVSGAKRLTPYALAALALVLQGVLFAWLVR